MAGDEQSARLRAFVQEAADEPVLEQAAREAKDPPYVMQIVGMVNGGGSVFDEQFLVEYNPEREGVDPLGRPMLAHIVTTDDPEKAKRYPSMVAALAEWKRVCKRQPIRPNDGQPNRPLTAFTIETVSLARALADHAEGVQRDRTIIDAVHEAKRSAAWTSGGGTST